MLISFVFPSVVRFDFTRMEVVGSVPVVSVGWGDGNRRQLHQVGVRCGRVFETWAVDSRNQRIIYLDLWLMRVASRIKYVQW